MDTSEVQHLAHDGTLAGAKGSGKLRVNPGWKNPSGSGHPHWHICEFQHGA